MNRSLLSVVVLSLCACNYTPLPSNDPDSGVSCLASQVPAGSGTTSGTNAFAVGSSYQRSGQYVNPDSGVVTGAQLDVRLQAAAVACASDAGAPGGESFFATIIQSGADRVAAGTFPVSGTQDGGSASFIGIGGFDGGARIATRGSLTLSSVQACSVSGSFAVDFPLGDGGFDPFSGTFSSEYCSR